MQLELQLISFHVKIFKKRSEGGVFKILIKQFKNGTTLPK